MKEIELTNSDVKAIVDDDVLEFILALGPWRLNSSGYAAMRGGAAFGTCYLHRLLMELFGHELTGLTVDHRDQNKLDNRQRNLRLATRRQQQFNRSRQRSNTSGFIGVYWHKRDRKWHARIRINGHQTYLGCFDGPTEAARAYDTAALGSPDAEFRVLNFPSGVDQC